MNFQIQEIKYSIPRYYSIQIRRGFQLVFKGKVTTGKQPGSFCVQKREGDLETF